ncbi:MMPL family transporter [Cellulomonas sp.]|uniref:MMPL family transporter n=1 Tax=Cellulomonas sp. TaxID=40001 RepID=UPI001B1472D0|nr:MMPL family transporter [Cellulomonas sp.]MBO9556839.1 MMPL family transporter [Cellulomonas sp.]
MAVLLRRLGLRCARAPWRVVAAWTVLLALAVAAYVAGAGTLSATFSLPGTPTQRVTEHLEEALPQAVGAAGTVVFSTTDGAAFTPAQQEGVSAALAAAGRLDGVQGVTDPFVLARDGASAAQQVEAGTAAVGQARDQLEQQRAELARAQEGVAAGGGDPAAVPELAAQAAALEEASAEVERQAAALALGQEQIEMAADLRSVSADGAVAIGAVVFDEPAVSIPGEVRQAAHDAIADHPVEGVRVDYSSTFAQDVAGILGVGEVVGVVIAALVLLVVLRSALAAALPVVTAVTGVGVGVTACLALSGVVDMVSVTPVLGVMLGLAVGIDYSLFVLNRHRRQLREGLELHESIGTAVGTSGNAVVFAGSTVVVALLALNVTGIAFLGLMGTFAAVCVVVAVLVALTLTPALLGLLGRRVLPRALRSSAPVAPRVPRPMSTGRAVVTVVGAVVVLGVVALPALSMRLGLPDGKSEAQDTTQYRAYVTTAEHFGEGLNGPLLVVADLPAPDRTLWPQGVDEVLATQVASELDAQDDVVGVARLLASDDGRVVAYQVVPREGPTSASTERLVHRLRALSDDLQARADVTIGVAGFASGNIDVSARLAAALPVYLGLVLGISLVIMTVVFRSLLVPLTATLGFLLSVVAALGGVVAIYQWGWLGDLLDVRVPGPVLSFLPTLLVGVLFGLAVDYQLFLVSGMREAFAHGAPARTAVAVGTAAGRAVVTAAAVIMVAVFGGFVFSDLVMIRPVGFGLAFGVLLDAFVVRLAVIPAVMHLLGPAAWWLPRWLDRVLPDVDVEGAALGAARQGVTGAGVADGEAVGVEAGR